MTTATTVLPIRIIQVGEGEASPKSPAPHAPPHAPDGAASGVRAVAQADPEDWVDDDAWDLPMDSLRTACEPPAPAAAPEPLACAVAPDLPARAVDPAPPAEPPVLEVSYAVYSPEDIVKLTAPHRVGWDAADALVSLEDTSARTLIMVAGVVGIVIGMALYGALSSF